MTIIFDFGSFLEFYSKIMCPIFDSSPIFSFFKISVFPLSTLFSRQNWKMTQLNLPKVRFPEIDQIEKCYVDCSWVSNKSLWRKFFVQFKNFFGDSREKDFEKQMKYFSRWLLSKKSVETNWDILKKIFFRILQKYLKDKSKIIANHIVLVIKCEHLGKFLYK